MFSDWSNHHKWQIQIYQEQYHVVLSEGSSLSTETRHNVDTTQSWWSI
jgi:hypothetical protein